MMFRTTLAKALATAAATVIAATGLVSCTDNSAAGDTIKIGTTDSNQKAWSVFEEKAKAANINLEVVPFSDYNTVNDAVSQGQIDVNKFQHLKFLATYNVKSATPLIAVGAGEIYPLDLFWKGHSNLDGIEGQEVAIPNDDSNQGRAITVLAQAGLVTLKDPDLVTPTPADIDKEKSKVTVVPVDAAQTPTVWGEGKPAIINNSWLDRTNIDPETAAFKDNPNATSSEPYINIFATTQTIADDPVKGPKIKELVKIWKDPDVVAAMGEDSKDTAVPMDNSPEELQEILTRLEDAVRSEK